MKNQTISVLLIFGFALTACGEAQFSSRQMGSSQAANQNLGDRLGTDPDAPPAPTPTTPGGSTSVPAPVPPTPTPTPAPIPKPPVYTPNPPPPSPPVTTTPPPAAPPCGVHNEKCIYTLSFPTPVRWDLNATACKPLGYLASLGGLGHGSACRTPGATTIVHWASALPQPNGCVAGQAPSFINTYVCRKCENGFRIVYRDVVIPSATYPSNWVAPPHTIPYQPVYECL